MDELFETILNNVKYDILKKHKSVISEVIKETKELNARIYIQVLDNCLEWIMNGKSSVALRALILSTINFVKNHFMFDKTTICGGKEIYEVCTDFFNYNEIAKFLVDRFPGLGLNTDNTIILMRTSINRKTEKSSTSSSSDTETKAEGYYEKLNEEFEKNIDLFRGIYFYGYELKIEEGVDDDTFKEINNFVKSGILL